MKLLRYGPKGQEKPGLLDEEGRIRDLSEKINDIDGAFLASDRLAQITKLETDSLPLVEGTTRLGPPVAGVGKIIAVGINYAAHGMETKIDIPEQPILFSKAVTSLSGPNDPVVLPKESVKGDWEVEAAAQAAGDDPLSGQGLEALDALTQLVHKLAGSGGTFGFAEISDAAERAETACGAMLETPSMDHWRSIEGHLEELRNAVEDARAGG